MMGAEQLIVLSNHEGMKRVHCTSTRLTRSGSSCR